MIRAQGVRLSVPQGTTLTGLDLTVQPGESAWITSDDSAGLSLLMRGLATHIRPEAGVLTVCGVNAIATPLAARRHLTHVARDPRLPHGLTVVEYLDFMSRSRQAQHVDALDLAKQWNLAPDAPAGRLPRAERRRVAMAGAAAAQARVCLLELPAATDMEVFASQRGGRGAREHCLIVACQEPPRHDEWHLFTLHAGRLQRGPARA